MAKEIILQVEGMDCASCTSKIEAVVCKIPGVENVSLNFTSQKLKYQLNEKIGDAKNVTKAIKQLGYKVNKFDKKADPADLHWWQTNKGRLTIVSGALLGIAWILAFTIKQYAEYAFAAAALLALAPMAKKAFLSAKAGQPFSIETLVTIAVIGAIFIGEATEAAVVVFLFSIGELLEMIAASKARKSVQALADLVPKSAFLVSENGVTEVEAVTLKVGDLIEVRPGGRIPADGIIEQGQSSIDEAAVTGESVPKLKKIGDDVFAGSINTDQLIRIKVEKSAQNNMISRILEMVEEAQASKAPTARFIDRFSNYYTPAIILVSALIVVVPPLFFGANWDVWIYKGLAILLIGCPCALVLSTPAAITSGISAGAKNGLLMKGGAVLEAIGRVKQIAFDKTGTLTKGKPKVTDVRTYFGEEKDMLALAGAVEAGSSHPLALAILDEVKSRNVKIPKATNSKSLNGRGVQASVKGQDIIVASPRYAAEISTLSNEQNKQIAELENEGKTIALTIADGKVLGIFAMRDELRDDAISSMARLKNLGINSIMLTGDNQRTGAALAKKLGIEVEAELMPQDKLTSIARLKQSGLVAMVGDGINDAPALASADVGIAMGGGTDVALETADAALLHERVSDVPDLVRLSRATMNNIYQNITMALGLKAVFLVTTLLGITSLWMAILADTGATVLVTMNALRLLGYRLKK
ncbi:Lead, cadmium, zinc and mercury transporting ATPase; Copper-translocating P-type ATPase [hydrothermal vent metagenome]|uniref:Lead, cadmium, zinc and mercury transporting ATPase Copper-translocating P-type ATPase n=1 Tax=hydrothermal vent metagenome TaxID=652676 RepID=A0A3B0WZR4_9ZZZZ